jgi:hypothetical protein
MDTFLARDRYFYQSLKNNVKFFPTLLRTFLNVKWYLVLELETTKLVCSRAKHGANYSETPERITKFKDIFSLLFACSEGKLTLHLGGGRVRFPFGG